MTVSSLAIQNVLGTYQRNLKHGEHEASSTASRRQPDFRTILNQAREKQQPMMSPRSVRERFGQGAVRDYKSASLEVYRKIQELP